MALLSKAALFLAACCCCGGTWVFPGKGAHGTAAAITPTANTTSAVGTTSNPVTFSTLASGTAAADRISAVALNNGELRGTPTGVTINGVTASQVVVGTNGGSYRSTIWACSNPTGTTADVVVTFGSASAETVSCSLFSITGANSTPHDTDSAGGTGLNSISISGLTIPAGGVAVFAGLCGDQNSGIAWTNATEYQDANCTTFRTSSAYSSTAGTPTFTADGGNNSSHVIAGAAWGP